MANWAVGHNMPGYLPESDVYVTSDWESARDALIEDLNRAQDSEWDLLNSDGTSETSDTIEETVMELSALEPETEYLAYVGDLAYWLNATDEEPDEDED